MVLFSSGWALAVAIVPTIVGSGMRKQARSKKQANQFLIHYMFVISVYTLHMYIVISCIYHKPAMLSFIKALLKIIKRSIIHLKTRPFKIQTFFSEFQMVFEKMAAICPDFKWFGFDFRPHSKSRPFANQPLLDHSKSRLGQISDPHCIRIKKTFLN